MGKGCEQCLFTQINVFDNLNVSCLEVFRQCLREVNCNDSTVYPEEPNLYMKHL